MSACSDSTVTWCAAMADETGSTWISHSASSRCPVQRSRTSPTPSTPGTSLSVCSAASVSAGSTLSISRRPTSRAACQPTTAIGSRISRPTTGSAQVQPSAAPPTPTSTPSEVNPSVRACSPSATSAADPIRRPVLMRYRATSSFPAKPSSAASATASRWVTFCGCASRSMATQAAVRELARITSTTATPARSSARPYP
jgi:hypothetical protein